VKLVNITVTCSVEALNRSWVLHPVASQQRATVTPEDHHAVSRLTQCNWGPI